MLLISVIIPIYNTALYLEKCIESVITQSYSDFELILINDGSTDNSGEIIEYYSKKDSRIIVIQKTNTGVSDTRNIGIRSAKGEAICFIDSDDWIDVDYLEVFVKNFQDHDTLLIQNIKRNGEVKDKYIYRSYNVYDEFDNLFTDNKLLYSGGPVAKFYCKSILSDHNIFFDNNVSYGEDLIFFLDYIKHIKFIRFLNTAKYHYIHNTNSLSTNRNYSLNNYAIVHEKIMKLIDWSKSKNQKTLNYVFSVDWDIIESGIDQNLHLPNSKIQQELFCFSRSLNKKHFHFANFNRKIIYLLLKTRNIFLLKFYKNTLAILVKNRNSKA